MSKILFYTIIFIAVTAKLNGQVNLVPNPSFEDTTQCPFNPGQVSFAVPWIDPTNASSDLFNSCNHGDVGVPNNISGTQSARTGNTYLGFATYYGGANIREYIQVQLDSQLRLNKNYYVEFYVSLADTMAIAANNIGAYFSNISITGSPGQVLFFTPQISNDPVNNPLTDKTIWTKVSGNFVANGSEKYITIGNFLNDISTDTVYVGSVCTGCTASYYYIDDISVICTDCSASGVNELSNNSNFSLYPNPGNGIMNFVYSLKQASKAEFILYDITGKSIAQYTLQPGQNNHLFIQETDLSNGVYFYKVMIDNEVKARDKVVIIK